MRVKLQVGDVGEASRFPWGGVLGGEGRGGMRDGMVGMGEVEGGGRSGVGGRRKGGSSGAGSGERVGGYYRWGIQGTVSRRIFSWDAENWEFLKIMVGYGGEDSRR